MLLIAEIGINHNGSLDKAMAMVRKAKESGADVAKFQMYSPSKLLGQHHPAFKEASQAQFTRPQHRELKQFCNELGIEYCLSVFHPKDVEFAEELGVRRYKVASRSVTDFGLLNELAKAKKPVLMSTGNFCRKEVRKAARIFDDSERLTILHCMPLYPTPLEMAFVGRISQYTDLSPYYGLSSHSPNIAPGVKAAVLGATAIEYHVCMSREEQGVDISSSLEFEEFALMAKLIRDMKKAN